MKVFICWSGQLSREVGEVFRKWLPGVLQSVKPYFTPDDVEKGTRWYSEISKELEESQIGIMILTRENIQSSWIMFEAGALSKQMDKSQICPILFGIDNTDLQGPLVQFQATLFNEEEINRLVKTINNACGEQKLENGVLSEVFKLWWPKLEKEISSRLQKYKESSDKKLRSDRGLIEEILSLVRISATRPRAIPIESISAGAIEHLKAIHSRLIDACHDRDYERIDSLVEELYRPIRYLIQITERRMEPEPIPPRPRPVERETTMRRRTIEPREIPSTHLLEDEEKSEET